MFIISASAMRSGSSWYLNLTNDVLKLKHHQNARNIRQDYNLDDIIVNDYMDIGKLQYRKLLQVYWVSLRTGTFAVKTHMNPTRGTNVFTAMNLLRSTYIYRDPRDRIISLMEMGERAHKEGDTKSPFYALVTFEGALRHIQQAYTHYDRWSLHPRTLVVQYESLVQNPLQEMRRLAQHLDIDASDEQLQGILDRYNRKTLTPDAKLTNYQKGQIGRYQDVLTQAQITQLEATLGDDLIKLGYAPITN